MDKRVLEEGRKQIGKYLQDKRKRKEITTYQITQNTGLRFETIKAIESGSANYAIDSFLTYISAIDSYFYLADREGKHLDQQDLIDKSK